MRDFSISSILNIKYIFVFSQDSQFELFVSSWRSIARDPILGGEHPEKFLLHDEHRRAQLVQIELSASIEQVVSLVPKLERPYRRMADLGQRRARGSRVQQQGKRASGAFHRTLDDSMEKFAAVKVARYQHARGKLKHHSSANDREPAARSEF